MFNLERYLFDPDCVLAERLNDRYDLRTRYTVSGCTMEKSPFGNALVFDGTNPDYVAIDSGQVKGNLIGTEDFSVVLWMKNSQTLATAGNAYCLVADKQEANGTEIGWSLNLQGGVVGGLSIRLNDGTDVVDFNSNLITSRNDLLSDGKFHLVGASVDRDGNVVGYVDNFSGEAKPVVAEAGTLSNNRDLTIGIMGNKTQWPFTGPIRDVLIFKNRLITEKEFQNIYYGKAF